jgi:hypothetical protein
MTEQEAEAWAARLTQIWQPVKVGRYSLNREGDFYWSAYLQGRALRHNVGLSVSFYADASETPSFHLSCEWGGQDVVARLSVTDDGHVERFVSQASKVAKREFTQRALAHWTPLFSRNCWLSGCPIEATAHEKMEWMQGFTKEEIEAWNLTV